MYGAGHHLPEKQGQREIVSKQQYEERSAHSPSYKKIKIKNKKRVEGQGRHSRPVVRGVTRLKTAQPISPERGNADSN